MAQKFRFPFPPYKIQEDFMSNLYETIEAGKIGIFESPTGTGKSLSLICGTLTWLEDYNKKQKEELEKILSGKKEEKQDTNDEPDWVNDFFEVKAAQELSKKIQSDQDGRKKRREKLQRIQREKQMKRKREAENKEKVSTNKEGEGQKENQEEDEDKDLVLEEYFSDEEKRKKNSNNDSSESEDEVEKKEEDENKGLKIFYCSRTHSQLSQFIHELRKSPFGESTKVVALGSRQNYCINEEVQQLKFSNKINEKCLDLQKKKAEKTKKSKEEEQPAKKRSKKTTSSGCPYYSHKKFAEFKEHLLDNVQDIEQLTSLGKDLDTCPYYGTRHSIGDAELVVLPYQTLLHKSTRETVGINLKDSVVIIDEAHNVIETINNVHSVNVSLSQLNNSVSQLAQYREKYKKRLKAKNLMYIDQILFVLKAIITHLNSEEQEKGKEAAYMATINNFLCKTKIDNVNLFKICRYCENSLIARKLNGFIDKYHGSVNQTQLEGNTTSSFLMIEALLSALTNYDKDGRILITKSATASKSGLKFLLLNPAVHFAEVIEECKAIVFAGGTMEPVSEFKDMLLYSAGVTNDRILQFSADHVIPPENLIALTLGKGPSSIDVNFNFQNRNRNDLIDELGRILCNVCTVVPGGVVCFFPSYDYEELVYTRLWSTGTLQRIEKRKKIFREPRKSGLTEKILQDYTNHIKKTLGKENSARTGALLLSVVGGKMSEGINFSDDLGRCIVMVGLPYPNKNSPELIEKMEFLNKNIGPNAGSEHYENICMKAVNQSIGRAIRHKNDYACILMVDQRYSKTSVNKKLPSWIRKQLVTHDRFGPCLGQISKFFAGKKKLKS
eukprot:TCONS_00025337-protein